MALRYERRRSLLWRKYDRYSPLCALHATCIFLATKSLSCSELIFPVSLAYYLSVCRSVLFCCILIGSDSILLEVGAGGAEKNRAIKRFRNHAISNRDFISISINRTALMQMRGPALLCSPFGKTLSLKVVSGMVLSFSKMLSTKLMGTVSPCNFCILSCLVLFI